MADPGDGLTRKPAVLLLDDGSRVELPDLTVGEAHDLVAQGRAMNEPIGGTLDAHRVKEVGFEEDES
jgi:hypothetical protein